MSSWRFVHSRGEVALLLMTVASGMAALWMTTHLDEGYNVLCSSETDLYQLADAPRASDFTFDPSGWLTIELENLDEVRWNRVEDGRTHGVIEGTNPKFILAPGISQTSLRGERTGVTLDFRVQWAPGGVEPLVSSGNLRVGEASPFAIEDFVIPAAKFPTDQVEEARQLVEPLNLGDRPRSIDRVALLAAFLHDQLEAHRGTPATQMIRLNGFEQYREARAGRSGVYCANHSEIFGFFANAVGLPTRLVDVAGSVGDVSVGAHSFVETYLEDEDRWVYVDLQLGLAGVRDVGGEFLNASQLLSRIRARMTTSLVVRRIRNSRIFEEPWAREADLFETFLTPASSLVFLTSATERFSMSERLRRLLASPRPSICGAGIAHRAESRIAVTWLAIVSGLSWFALRIRRRAVSLRRWKGAVDLTSEPPEDR